MFDASYRRAKEGELARTILANPLVVAARVHIFEADENTFDYSETSKASVYITTRGSKLPEPHVSAFRHLVSSAIRGLDPKNVAIVDSRHGLINAQDDVQRLGNDLLENELKAKLQIVCLELDGLERESPSSLSFYLEGTYS